MPPTTWSQLWGNLTLRPLWVLVAWGVDKAGLGGTRKGGRARGGPAGQGRWAWHKAWGASAESGTALLHGVMGRATAGCAATRMYSSASLMHRHLLWWLFRPQNSLCDVTLRAVWLQCPFPPGAAAPPGQHRCCRDLQQGPCQEPGWVSITISCRRIRRMRLFRFTVLGRRI